MDEQDHVEINLDPIATKAEEPEIQVVKAEETPEPPKKKLRNEVSPEDGIQELRAKLDQERQARVDAERRAQEAANREFQAKNEVQDTNLHLVTNAIDTVRRENDMLTSSYAEAMGSGDYDRASKIQRAMATNEARLLQLENGKAAMESQPKQAPPKPQYADHVEALASQVTPASANWLRQLATTLERKSPSTACSGRMPMPLMTELSPIRGIISNSSKRAWASTGPSRAKKAMTP